MKKILSVVLVLTLTLAMATVCFAAPPDDFTPKDVSELDDASNAIIGAIQVGATVVAICMLLFVGIKFMMAAPAEKANLKGALIPYIVGAVLIFAAIPILSLISKFASNNI